MRSKPAEHLGSSMGGHTVSIIVRHPPQPKHDIDLIAVLLAVAGAITVAILLTVTLCGCRTNGVRADAFPAEIAGECMVARSSAVRWYAGKHKAQPSIPPVEVIVSAVPPRGHGAITEGAGAGYRITIWRDQRPFLGSLEHEFRHVLTGANGNGMSEEAVK